MRNLLVLLLCAPALAQWQMLDTHSTESLRGVSALNELVIWASGTHGTYLHSEDGGNHWASSQVAGAESLDFRGVVAMDRGVFLLAAGPGEQSRIYHTADRGGHWDLQFTNHERAGFFDCMAFFDERRGLVVGDPVNGKFQILRTEDGGKTWNYSDPKKMPDAVQGEGAFAASNSCLTVQGKKNAWFVTGGTAARVFRSSDGGKSWKVSDSPITHGPASAGIFSIAFRDGKHGVIAGGDYAKPELAGANLATTQDGGRTWKLETGPQQKFYSAICYVQSGASENDGAVWLAAVGSGWSGYTKDGLKSWEWSSTTGFNALGCKGEMIYAAGSGGRIARMRLSGWRALAKAVPTK